MVDYRFDLPDPVGSMARGYALGSQIRQGSNDQKYAKAASDEERARLANEAGDFARAEAFKKRVDAQSERDWQVGQRRLQVMQNLGNRLLSIPYEQRKATLEQWKPSILQNFPMFTAEQIDALDPTDEWIRGELAQAGQMGEYVKLEKGQRGEIIGYKADGSVVTVKDAAPEVGVSPSGVAYVQNADGTVQVTGNVPGYAVPRAAAGGGANGGLSLTEFRQARDKASALQALLSSMDNAVKVLPNKLGIQTMAGVGKEAASLDAAYKDLQILWKEAANLGALTGPDMDLIKGALGDPTSVETAWKGGADGIRLRLDQARGAIKRRLEQLQRYYPQAFEGENAALVEQPAASDAGGLAPGIAPENGVEGLSDDALEQLARERGLLP